MAFSLSFQHKLGFSKLDHSIMLCRTFVFFRDCCWNSSFFRFVSVIEFWQSPSRCEWIRKLTWRFFWKTDHYSRITTTCPIFKFFFQKVQLMWFLKFGPKFPYNCWLSLTQLWKNRTLAGWFFSDLKFVKNKSKITNSSRVCLASKSTRAAVFCFWELLESVFVGSLVIAYFLRWK